MSSFFRVLAGLFLAVALANSASAAPAFNNPELVKIAEQGSWSAYQADDGSVMLVDKFEGGGKVAFVVLDDKVHLAVTDPAWDLPAGRKFAITVEVDGSPFTGTAEPSPDGTMVLSGNLSRDFLRTFYRGRHAVIEVAGSQWSLGLSNAARVIDAASSR